MRALVLSDLHANAEALRAVLSHVRRKKFDAVICLGDFVGYGAEPNQVLDSMRSLKGRKLYIRGNHDRIVAGQEEGGAFNAAARVAAQWTQEHLSPPNRRFLERLPLGPIQRGEILLCHGSPDDEDEYLFHDLHASRVFEQTEAPIVLFGHTHLPAIFSIDQRGTVRGSLVQGDATFRLDGARRFLINPGSVGQPRDRNPRASFVILDTAKLRVQFFRVWYDVAKTQTAIRKAGLPAVLANRLKFGT